MELKSIRPATHSLPHVPKKKSRQNRKSSRSSYPLQNRDCKIKTSAVCVVCHDPILAENCHALDPPCLFSTVSSIPLPAQLMDGVPRYLSATRSESLSGNRAAARRFLHTPCAASVHSSTGLPNGGAALLPENVRKKAITLLSRVNEAPTGSSLSPDPVAGTTRRMPAFRVSQGWRTRTASAPRGEREDGKDTNRDDSDHQGIVRNALSCSATQRPKQSPPLLDPEGTFSGHYSQEGEDHKEKHFPRPSPGHKHKIDSEKKEQGLRIKGFQLLHPQPPMRSSSLLFNEPLGDMTESFSSTEIHFLPQSLENERKREDMKDRDRRKESGAESTNPYLKIGKLISLKDDKSETPHKNREKNSRRGAGCIDDEGEQPTPFKSVQNHDHPMQEVLARQCIKLSAGMGLNKSGESIRRRRWSTPPRSSLSLSKSSPQAISIFPSSRCASLKERCKEGFEDRVDGARGEGETYGGGGKGRGRRSSFEHKRRTPSDCLDWSSTEHLPVNEFPSFPIVGRDESPTSFRCGRQGSRYSPFDLLSSSSFMQPTPTHPFSRPRLHVTRQAMIRANQHSSFLLRTPTKTFSFVFPTTTLSSARDMHQRKEENKRRTPLRDMRSSSSVCPPSPPPPPSPRPTTVVVHAPPRPVGLTASAADVVGTVTISKRISSLARGKPVLIRTSLRGEGNVCKKKLEVLQQLMEEEERKRKDAPRQRRFTRKQSDGNHGRKRGTPQKVRMRDSRSTSGSIFSSASRREQHDRDGSNPGVSMMAFKVNTPHAVTSATTALTASATSSTSVDKRGVFSRSNANTTRSAGAGVTIEEEGALLSLDGVSSLSFLGLPHEIEFAKEDGGLVGGTLVSEEGVGLTAGKWRAEKEGNAYNGDTTITTTNTSGDENMGSKRMREGKGRGFTSSGTQGLECSPSPRGPPSTKRSNCSGGGGFSPISRTTTADPHSVGQPVDSCDIRVLPHGQQCRLQGQNRIQKSNSGRGPRESESGLRRVLFSSARGYERSEDGNSSPRIYNSYDDVDVEGEANEGGGGWGWNSSGPRQWSVETAATAPFESRDSSNG